MLVETPAVPYLTLLLARDEAVHKELQLNGRQVAEVEAAVANVDEPFWVLRDVPVAQCGEKLDLLVGRLRGKLKATLSPGQMKRFDEIILQARGYKALLAPDMAEKLRLSESQVTARRKALAETPRRQTAARGENESDDRAAGHGSNAAAGQSVASALSADQAALLRELAGKPFDVRQVRQVGCVAPELRSVDNWINSEPTTLAAQRGKVVAIHFWAFDCVNCVHNLPHYQRWHATFPKSRFSVIGIHTPETQRERSVDGLRESVRQRGIEYPVAVDAGNANWNAWGNRIWPSVYLIDKRGRVRYWWYGELNWQGSNGEAVVRKKISELLAED